MRCINCGKTLPPLLEYGYCSSFCKWDFEDNKK